MISHAHNGIGLLEAPFILVQPEDVVDPFAPLPSLS